MIIKKYTCKRFAGIKDKDIEFEDGLNVILGPNEAGKSTLVEGIHSVLFKPSKLGYRTSEDKDFRSRFMPIQAGDTIDGELIVTSSEGDYRLGKEWGEEPKSYLVMPSDQILKNEDNINDALKELLVFGEGTYSSIFFSKQSSLKKAIENIMNNKEATSEVSSLLRRAIMELDGISLDKLGKKIDDELESLYKRWDIQRNYPENNRGISNPYKVGFGEIVDSFYRKEGLRLEMDKADEAEKQYNEVCDALRNVEERMLELKNTKDEMEKLENDIIQRSILEPQIEQFDKDMLLITRINQEWPRSEEKLKQLELEVKEWTIKLENLEDEKKQSNKLAEKNVLALNVEKIKSLNEKLKDIELELTEIKPISKEDIIKLENSYNEIKTVEAMMKAGTIIGKLNRLDPEWSMLVTKDLDEPIAVSSGDDFRANGYLKLQCSNLFELELKSGDMDFNQLRAQYENQKNSFEELLVNLQIKSIEEAKLNNEKWTILNRSLENYSDKVSEILNGETYEALIEKLEAYGDLSKIRTLDIIDDEIKTVNITMMELNANKKVIEADINKWTYEYENIDGLFEKIIEIKMNQKGKRDDLNKLAILPEGYNSPEDFRDKLIEIRKSYETSSSSLAKLKELYYEREKNLSDSTYEDLLMEYASEEKIFTKKLEKGKKLLKIKEAFDETRNKMDDSSFNPVIKTFSNYLSILTNGNYKVKDIDKDFNLMIHKEEYSIMPLNLLSSGTYDSVALALRFSILEYILKDKKGFVILDDCLVDLDPYRRDMASKLINEFAKKHQVIFTTCSPDTADLLGGRLIKLK